MSPSPRASRPWAAAAVLAVAGLLAAGLLGALAALTREPIAQAQAQAERAALAVVLPAALHDNDLLADHVTVVAPRWLGSAEPQTVWRARRGGSPRALALQAIAPDGYNGDIALLVGVRIGGRVSGVRVRQHRETPGLGDRIEAARDPWITRFDHRSLHDPAPTAWSVRRDGGAFDQFAGATITPRAVVHATRRVLAFVERHGAALYAAPAGARLEFNDGE